MVLFFFIMFIIFLCTCHSTFVEPKDSLGSWSSSYVDPREWIQLVRLHGRRFYWLTWLAGPKWLTFTGWLFLFPIAFLSRHCTLLAPLPSWESPLQFRFMFFALYITLLGVACKALDSTTNCLALHSPWEAGGSCHDPVTLTLCRPGKPESYG